MELEHQKIRDETKKNLLVSRLNSIIYFNFPFSDFEHLAIWFRNEKSKVKLSQPFDTDYDV